MNNELIEKYLYNVTKRLPEKQKNDIEKELRSLIEDMIDERISNGEPQETVVQSVLEELGSPAKLAAKYRGDGDYLIGGEYYHLYLQVLKIVLICVGVGVAISAIVSFFVNASAENVDGIVSIMKGGFRDLFMIPSALVEAFGIVTIIFIILEKNRVKVQNSKEKWNISMLQEIPDKKARVDIGDCIGGIIFGIIVSVIFICIPELAGAWIKDENDVVVAIPIFNLSVFQKALPFLLLSLISGVIQDTVKLIIGRYNAVVMWITVALSTMSFAFSVIAFKCFDIWNLDFVREISRVSGKTFSADGDFLAHWERFVTQGTLSNIFVVLFMVGTIVEILVTVIKTCLYGMKNKNVQA